MMATDETANFYEVLGVPENATADEIKRAYFRLVRQYRPTDYPEQFQRFSVASRTLSDPRRRNEYDQLRRAGKRVQVLVDQAAVAAEKDPHKAITLLKSAIALAPDTLRPRLLLAQVMMRMGEHTAAEKQYRWLLKEAPRDETLHLKLARCLLAQERMEEALEALNAATHINARFYDAYMLLARIYEKTDKQALAVYALEKAIENDGVEDFADFEALTRLCVLYLKLANQPEVEKIIARLLAVLEPGNAPRSTRAIRRLLGRARDFVEQEEYRMAVALLVVAEQIPGVEDSVTEEVRQRLYAARLLVEADQVGRDDLITPALRLCIRIRYLDRLPENERRGRLDEAILKLQDEVRDDPRRVQGAVEYLRREYLNIAVDLNALLTEIATRAARRVEWLAAQTTSPEQDEAPGVMPRILSEPSPVQNNSGPAGRRSFLGWLRGNSSSSSSGSTG